MVSSAKMSTLIFNWLLSVLSYFSIDCGAHRLWSHRSYKAKWQLRVLLAVFQTLTFQMDIYHWARDHRVHHVYSETDGDPHNAKRGFFFAHVGWLLCHRHPDVTRLGKKLDMSDLIDDPIVKYQHKFYYPLLILTWLTIPISVPVYYFHETWLNSFLVNCFRFAITLQTTSLVNSLAHIGPGGRPYDKRINPRETTAVSYLTFGEGYHNYHHAFPGDYSASEYGWSDNWNPSTAVIDMFARIGWAYDLKATPESVVRARVERTGDLAAKSPKLTMVYVWLDIVIGMFYVTWFVWLA
ncbi:unnamed protein product, partial [Oppiella nova]